VKTISINEVANFFRDEHIGPTRAKTKRKNKSLPFLFLTIINFYALLLPHYVSCFLVYSNT